MDRSRPAKPISYQQLKLKAIPKGIPVGKTHIDIHSELGSLASLQMRQEEAKTDAKVRNNLQIEGQ
jgi:hypothetical protein|tara:strand:- start:21935 stop:22132 length:198 start_codon:yes stop_codon:yes gene_type:complete